ncbi:MAG: hypothetical protein HKN47_03350 [Pirellulaceae bacterium]|nr:hypothetical protein [Pirellulaceae bacterium]
MSDQFGQTPQNPYAATSTLETQAMPAPTGSYGGIGRLAYFGYSFLAAIVYNIALVAMGAALGENAMFAVIPLMLIYFGVLFWIIAQRMINAAYSPWWCLGMLVPILNILVGIRAIACPEGYGDHGQLDTAGKIIIGLFLGMIALAVIAVVVSIAAAG